MEYPADVHYALPGGLEDGTARSACAGEWHLPFAITALREWVTCLACQQVAGRPAPPAGFRRARRGEAGTHVRRLPPGARAAHRCGRAFYRVNAATGGITVFCEVGHLVAHQSADARRGRNAEVLLDVSDLPAGGVFIRIDTNCTGRPNR